jgi:thiol-disulfide isomerase/thioredoxin
MLVVNSASTIAKYNNLIAKNKPIFVLFHAKWCFHCKKLEPIWKNFMKNVKETMPIVSIESSFVEHVNGFKKINGFPTLIIIRGDNEISVYEGQRTLAGIKQFYMKYSKQGGSKKHSSSTKKHSSSTKKRRQTRRMRGGGCGCNQFN